MLLRWQCYLEEVLCRWHEVKGLAGVVAQVLQPFIIKQLVVNHICCCFCFGVVPVRWKASNRIHLE